MSVVVPATNQPPTLARCTAAILATREPPDELIVVDDAGLSASAARNAGARRASGDVVVFVDADVEVHADAVSRIRATFDAPGAPAAVFGSYDDEPDHPGIVSAFRNLLHHHVHHHGAGRAETFWTGLGAVRRDTFFAVGGFDEARYPLPSIEDIELGDRLRASRADVRLDPRIQGKHLKAWTLRSMLWTDVARRAVPWIALQLRTGRFASTLNLGWRHRLSAAACVAALLAVVAARPEVSVAALALLVTLNQGFYRLLARQLGVLPAVAGVGLHGLHHLVSVLAVPVGLGLALWSWAGPAAAVTRRGVEPAPVVE